MESTVIRFARKVNLSIPALIFDCDSVLADTERDGHHIAFNRTFAEFGSKAEWDVEDYGELLGIAGGKERLRQFLDQTGWPTGASDDHDGYLDRLHACKSRIFQAMVKNGQVPLQPGIEWIARTTRARPAYGWQFAPQPAWNRCSA